MINELDYFLGDSGAYGLEPADFIATNRSNILRYNVFKKCYLQIYCQLLVSKHSVPKVSGKHGTPYLPYKIPSARQAADLQSKI